MEKKLYFLPLAVLANSFLLIWWYFRAEDFIFVISFLVAINFFLALKLKNFQKNWWNFSFFPIIFSFSSLFYSLIVSQRYFVLLIIIFALLVISFYWRLIFSYIFKPAIYRPFSLEKFFSFFSFFSIFFLVSGFYGLRTFINPSIWQIIIVFMIMVIMLIYQWTWFNKIKWQLAWPYCLVILLVLTQLFIVFNLLPINFNVSGFVISSSWHGLIFLSSEKISGKLTFFRSRFIIFLIIFIWLAVLLTTSWF